MFTAIKQAHTKAIVERLILTSRDITKLTIEIRLHILDEGLLLIGDTCKSHLPRLISPKILFRS